jgi:hypothetical protein
LIYAKLKPYGVKAESMIVALKDNATKEYAASYCVEFKLLKDAPKGTRFWSPWVQTEEDLNKEPVAI